MTEVKIMVRLCDQIATPFTRGDRWGEIESLNPASRLAQCRQSGNIRPWVLSENKIDSSNWRAARRMLKQEVLQCAIM